MVERLGECSKKSRPSLSIYIKRYDRLNNPTIEPNINLSYLPYALALGVVLGLVVVSLSLIFASLCLYVV
jgi:hypothetical protein